MLSGQNRHDIWLTPRNKRHGRLPLYQSILVELLSCSCQFWHTIVRYLCENRHLYNQRYCQAALLYSPYFAAAYILANYPMRCLPHRYRRARTRGVAIRPSCKTMRDDVQNTGRHQFEVFGITSCNGGFHSRRGSRFSPDLKDSLSIGKFRFWGNNQEPLPAFRELVSPCVNLLHPYPITAHGT